MRVRQKHACRKSATAWRHAGHSVLLACAMGWIATGTAYGETLRQVVETALKTHPRVLAADAQRRAAAQDLAQAQAGFFPTVDLNLASGKEHTETPQVRATGTDSANLTRREAGLTLSQKLFDGKATASEIDRQTARVNAAASRLAEVREEIALKATEGYLEVLKNRQLVKLANDNLKAHLQTREKVRLRVEGGVAQKTDLQQAQGRVALAKSIASARAGRLLEAEANFQATVGKAPADLDDPGAKATETVKSGAINTALLAQAIKQASETAITSSPALSTANAEISAAEASVRGAKAPFYPRLNLELSANRNENLAGIKGNYDSEALMLVLRWNLFRGGADQAQERALAERRYAAIDAAANTRRDVEERVAVALHAKATSEERLAYLQEHASLSAEVLDSYQQQLELGRRSLLDVLNAENELFTARSNHVAGRYEDLFNQYAVEAAKGLLVNSLGIAPAD